MKLLPQIKLPKKLPQFFAKRKLQAATRRAEPQEFAEQEPNVKLSSAFAIVLVLHVVAVGGIYAFNSIKANHAAVDATPAKAENGEQKQGEVNSAMMAGAAAGGMKTYRVKPGDTLSKIAVANGVSADDIEEANGLKNVGGLRVGQDLKIPAKPAPKPVASDSHKIAETKKPAETASAKETGAPSAPKDSGETYAVARGDSPVGIAKKLKVSYDDLLKLNKVDDPKKLQIGQKLKVPARRAN
jgi:LysM repeat protein